MFLVLGRVVMAVTSAVTAVVLYYSAVNTGNICSEVCTV